MTATRPVQYRRMTPDEVLAELRLICRNWGISEVDIEKYVRPESSLLELGKREPEADWGDLISHHGLSLPDDEWFAACRSIHTVEDFCEAVADLNEVPVIEPVTVLGTLCETAGAFLTLKRMLAEKGVDVSQLGPSSEVAPHLWERPEVFQWFRLATGRQFPPFHQLTHWSFLAMLLSLLGAGVLWLVKAEIGACALVAIGFLFLLIAVHAQPRFRPTFDGGQVATFRDLIHVALGRPARA